MRRLGISRCHGMRNKTATEHQIQSAFFDLVRLHYPDSKLIYAVPNGAYKSGINASKFQREGLIAGMPDVNIDIARGQYHGMRIEHKSCNGRISADQKKAMKQLEIAGYYCIVSRAVETSWHELIWYLKQ